MIRNQIKILEQKSTSAEIKKKYLEDFNRIFDQA